MVELLCKGTHSPQNYPLINTLAPYTIPSGSEICIIIGEDVDPPIPPIILEKTGLLLGLFREFFFGNVETGWEM